MPHEHEYELVRHDRFKNLNLFVIQMFSRTPHLHLDLELGLVLDGVVSLHHGSDTTQVKAGDLYLIPPMEIHSLGAAEAGAHILVLQTSYKLMNSFLPEPAIPRFEQGGNLRELLSESPEKYALLRLQMIFLATYFMDEADPDPFRCFDLLSRLLYLLICTVPHRQIGQEDYLPMKKKADRMRSILNYIDENYNRKLLLEEVAEHEQLSMVYLSHFFKEQVGMSFQDYLKQKRFEEARRLLLTGDQTIMDICFSCGFSDMRYMSRVFQESLGMTPKEYRNSGVTYQNPAVPATTTERRLSAEEAMLILRPLEKKLMEEDAEKLTQALLELYASSTV